MGMFVGGCAHSPQLTDCVDFQGSEDQEVSLLLPQLALEHGCHLMAFEELMGRVTLNKNQHLGTAETDNNISVRKRATVAALATDSPCVCDRHSTQPVVTCTATAGQ